MEIWKKILVGVFFWTQCTYERTTLYHFRNVLNLCGLYMTKNHLETTVLMWRRRTTDGFCCVSGIGRTTVRQQRLTNKHPCHRLHPHPHSIGKPPQPRPEACRRAARCLLRAGWKLRRTGWSLPCNKSKFRLITTVADQCRLDARLLFVQTLFYRTSACEDIRSATAISSVCPSVCLSAIFRFCVKTA